MSDKDRLTPAAAAQIIGVNSHTIRRWCADHAAYLSLSANPEKGLSRTLSGRDIEVLRTIAQLRTSGMLTPAINVRLDGLTFAEIDTEVSTDEHTLAPPAPQEAQGHAPALIVVVDDHETRLARLEASSKATEQARSEDKRLLRDGLTMFALGFIAAAIMFGAFVLLASTYAK